MQKYPQSKQQLSSRAFEKAIIDRDKNFLDRHKKELLSADNLEHGLYLEILDRNEKLDSDKCKRSISTPKSGIDFCN